MYPDSAVAFRPHGEIEARDRELGAHAGDPGHRIASPDAITLFDLQESCRGDASMSHSLRPSSLLPGGGTVIELQMVIACVLLALAWLILREKGDARKHRS